MLRVVIWHPYLEIRLRVRNSLGFIKPLLDFRLLSIRLLDFLRAAVWQQDQILVSRKNVCYKDVSVTLLFQLSLAELRDE